MIYVAGPITEYRSGRDVGPFVEVATPCSGSFRTMKHHVDQALNRVFSRTGCGW